MVIIEMLSGMIKAARIEGSRTKEQMAVDRLRQAAGEPTLELCINKFAELMQCDQQYLNHQVFLSAMEEAASPAASGILAMLRTEPVMAVMAATLDAPADREAAAGLLHPIEAGTGGAMKERYGFDTGVEVTLLSPLAHGGDIKAGNATMFRRMQVNADGHMMSLPFFSGNAFRGQLRDALADHFLEALGIEPSRSQPRIALWAFYMLYSGGALAEKSAATERAVRALGANGAAIADGIHEFRDALPPVSALGAAVGSKILCGRVRVNDLRPRCLEWGNGAGSCGGMMEYQFLTRREKCECAAESHAMIAVTEVLRAGVSLEGGIDYTHATELDKSCICRGLDLVRQAGYIGGESRRGMGRCIIHYQGQWTDPDIYDSYLEKNKDAIVHYLEGIGFFDKSFDGEAVRKAKSAGRAKPAAPAEPDPAPAEEPKQKELF